MFDKIKANIVFSKLSKRRSIEKAYAMVPPEDAWYDTIYKVHTSVAEVRKLPHKTLEIISHDDLSLVGEYYPCEDGRGVTVIWVHGYTSHAERESAFPALFYRSLGYNVLVPYLRAHGPSEGNYISFGALEHWDIMRWVKKINKMNPDDSIVIHGLSMGGGVVLNLADKEMQNVKCLIADAPLTSIAGSFRNICKGVFRKQGDKVCDQLLLRFHDEFGVDAANFEGAKAVSGSKYPLFLTAGSEEHLDSALLELQKCSASETEVLILPGCNHGNGMYKQTELYQNALKVFIEKHIVRE